MKAIAFTLEQKFQLWKNELENLYEQLLKKYAPEIDALKRASRRLDFRLTTLVGVVVFLWFVSFVISVQLIHGQSLQKDVTLEREKILSKLKNEETQILNDIILDHHKALELASGDLYHSQNLKWLELKTIKGKVFTFGSLGESKEKIALDEVYPIIFEGKEYGRISFEKELSYLGDSRGLARKWIFGITIIMILIFFIVQRFINQQMVLPIQLLISNFSSGKDISSEEVSEKGATEIENLYTAFSQMQRGFKESQEKMITTERDVALGALAAQVAHDIRSPLAALQVMFDTLETLPENQRLLLRTAIQRITDIANNLLHSGSNQLRKPTAKSLKVVEKSSELIDAIVNIIVSEKRVQYSAHKDVVIEYHSDLASKCVFSSVNRIEFERLLSNLINNSVEAITASGKIEIDLASTNENLILTIKDNGKGMPPDLIEALGTRGTTFGKKEGSGLGLYHAIKMVESWDGKIEISSAPEIGTAIQITLAKAVTPVWFLPTLEVAKKSVLIVIDDDDSIHDTWKNRFPLGLRKSKGVSLRHFTNVEAFKRWWNIRPSTALKLLVDYELIGSNQTGLELISELGLEKNAVLVTSHCEEKEIIEECVKKGIKILPKSLASSLPIMVSK